MSREYNGSGADEYASSVDEYGQRSCRERHQTDHEFYQTSEFVCEKPEKKTTAESTERRLSMHRVMRQTKYLLTVSFCAVAVIALSPKAKPEINQMEETVMEQEPMESPALIEPTQPERDIPAETIDFIALDASEIAYMEELWAAMESGDVDSIEAVVRRPMCIQVCQKLFAAGDIDHKIKGMYAYQNGVGKPYGAAEGTALFVNYYSGLEYTANRNGETIVSYDRDYCDILLSNAEDIDSGYCSRFTFEISPSNGHWIEYYEGDSQNGNAHGQGKYLEYSFFADGDVFEYSETGEFQNGYLYNGTVEDLDWDVNHDGSEYRAMIENGVIAHSSSIIKYSGMEDDTYADEDVGEVWDNVYAHAGLVIDGWGN